MQDTLTFAGEYKNMKVKPISEIIGSHRDNVKVALDAVQSKLKPLNQSISILKDEEHEMKVLGNFVLFALGDFRSLSHSGCFSKDHGIVLLSY